MGFARSLIVMLTAGLLVAAPVAGQMNIVSTNRYVESGIHLWPTAFGLSQGAFDHYENVTTTTDTTTDPFVVGVPGNFQPGAYQNSTITPLALTVASRANETVFNAGNQYSQMNFAKSVYEVEFMLNDPTPFVLTFTFPPPSGTAPVTLTSPSQTVQSFSVFSGTVHNMVLTPGLWKFAANAIADGGPNMAGGSLLAHDVSLAVAPEPAGVMLTALAGFVAAGSRRRRESQ